MRKLWEKNWRLNPLIEAFETEEDLLVDQKLIKFDVLATLAHVKMLQKIRILSQKEFKTLWEGLLKILSLEKEGKFVPKLYEDEDIHTKIENFLTENYGDVGKKVHTGRSRNDQVLTAIRLLTKEELLSIWKELLGLLGRLLDFAKKYEFMPIPGYTHLQKAMPTSLGMWAGSFAESLFDDLKLLKTVYQLNNQSPLGSASGFGVPLPLDREYTAKLLGFEKVQSNALYCQNSRGKIEAVVVASLMTIFMDVNRLASDILLFTTREFGFFEVADELCTGSSFMPQKKNIDVAELLRSKVHLILGHYVQLVSLSSNLTSGYNRDLQDSKKPLFEVLAIGRKSLQATNILVKNLSPREEALKKSLTPEMFATHKVIELVKQGVPFREAHQKVGSSLSFYQAHYQLDNILRKSTHTGGTGNLGLSTLSRQLEKEKQEFKEEDDTYLSTIKNLQERR